MNKTKLFVARDKALGGYSKGMVHLFADKPYRNNNGMGMEYWESEINGTIWLGDDVFPELKLEDEPMEVDIIPKGSLWENIKDEEPKETGLYLTYSESNGINIAFWNNSWCSCGETIDTDSITHWMPLPNKPKTE